MTWTFSGRRMQGPGNRDQGTRVRAGREFDPHWMWSTGPEFLVDLRGFFFDQGADDLDWSLASGEDFAAGQVEGGNFRAAAGDVNQAFSGEGVDDAADAGPVDGSGAHGAGFGAGVEGAFGEDFVAEELGGFGAGEALCVLGWLAFGADGVVAGGDDDLAVFVDDEGAERMSAVSAGCAGELDGLA